MTMTTTTTKTFREEKVYVLYGSQTGNSEQAAKDFCRLVATKLSPEAIQKYTHKNDNVDANVTVVPHCMQLDDFLELERAAWTRLTVIFTSSYGVGQAPLGGYRFRELCDAWYNHQATTNDDKSSSSFSSSTKVLDGFYFCLCGLGDSKYTTYFQNPTRIDQALRMVGAQRVGPLGQCDASGTGDDEQGRKITRWIENIWPHLAAVVVQAPLSTHQLQRAQKDTVELCRQINPDFIVSSETDHNKTNISMWMVLVVVIIAILAARMVQQQQ